MPRRSFLIRHIRAHPPDERNLQKYLLQWRTGDLYANPEEFPRLAARDLFGRPGLLSIEIGCSTGEYLCSLAREHPDRLFVGIDINLKSLVVATGHAAAQSLENIRFIKAPMQWLYPLMQPETLEAVYVHFPDPSLRPKYRKRQLLNETLMDNIHAALVPGGILSFVTDNAELFEGLLELVEADRRFEKTHGERYVGFEPGVKSRYQLYWEQHGIPIKRVELRKHVG
ncbi:MAG TPA: methyltransferase domain-containing protein [Chloroflexia bacterium]|jgi:tRNA (guanine-N7-)-methyltransferase